jgi:hypothetical protein
MFHSSPCWIAQQQQGCDESCNHGGETTCTRGVNASLYRWVFYYAPLWLAIIQVTINMFLVYRTVYAQEKNMARYDFEAKKQNSRQRRSQECSRYPVNCQDTGSPQHDSRFIFFGSSRAWYASNTRKYQMDHHLKHSRRVARQGILVKSWDTFECEEYIPTTVL